MVGSGSARGQSTPAAPDRSAGWDQATNVLAVSSVALQALLPRIFYSDPDVTVGWKARWHISVLAPTMTLTTLALFNELSLKTAFADGRPGCTDATEGQTGCTSYGLMSTQSFVAASALGQGVGTFLVDTLHWSHGQMNVGALIGQGVVPLVIAPIVAVGRTAGDWESPAQSWGSAGVGLLVGFGLGVAYAFLQRPECGYTGNLICF
jgi:hypothetical protein